MQIMLVFEIQIFVHQIQPVDFWFNISYSVPYICNRLIENRLLVIGYLPLAFLLTLLASGLLRQFSLPSEKWVSFQWYTGCGIQSKVDTNLLICFQKLKT